ncbi:hypothetical protein BC835DRAFT_487987 [Cytidiella melzeri]|nr:hypothetical protein BC835DRAFT_487987 [Cytidiella melzeri]
MSRMPHPHHLRTSSLSFESANSIYNMPQAEHRDDAIGNFGRPSALLNSVPLPPWVLHSSESVHPNPEQTNKNIHEGITWSTKERGMLSEEEASSRIIISDTPGICSAVEAWRYRSRGTASFGLEQAMLLHILRVHETLCLMPPAIPRTGSVLSPS